jgi:hypothetical protein
MEAVIFFVRFVPTYKFIRRENHKIEMFQGRTVLLNIWTALRILDRVQWALLETRRIGTAVEPLFVQDSSTDGSKSFQLYSESDKIGSPSDLMFNCQTISFWSKHRSWGIFLQDLYTSETSYFK